MLESMLEPHLRETGASTLDVGLSFLIFGCCYMLGNMFFGQARDFSQIFIFGIYIDWKIINIGFVITQNKLQFLNFRQ